MAEPSDPGPQTGASAAPHAGAWDLARLRAFGHEVVEHAVRHLAEVDDGPVHRAPGPDVRRFFEQPLGEEGASPEALLEEFASRVAPYPMGNGHRRFSGWVNSPPDPMGVFAALLAAAMNPSCAGLDQSAVLLEQQVVAWFAELFGFPREAMGLLTSGGSMATLHALAAARQRAGGDPRTEGLKREERELLCYATREAHSCIQKSVELLGLGARGLRTVATDAAGGMDMDDLRRQLAADTGDPSVTPMAVCASVGTASAGVIDPIEQLADLCAEHSVWLHLDGAYGGVCAWLEEYAELGRAVARADSLAVDPHKWLGVPVDAGLVLVRHPHALREAFELVPDYLRDDASLPASERPFWFSHHGFEQTRPFRALSVWMTLRHRGLAGIRGALQRDLAVARRFAAAVRQHAELTLWEPQGLGIVCYRFDTGTDIAPEDADALNRELLRRLQAEGRVYPSGTVLDGRFHLRSCFLHPRTTHADTELLLQESVRVGRRLAGRV